MEKAKLYVITVLNGFSSKLPLSVLQIISQDLIIYQQADKHQESIMIKRTIFNTANNQNYRTPTLKKSNSNSTLDSGECLAESKPNKQKSQLCKKFMDNGYCPYDKRCKFAHGLDQLRKNNEYNSKYKTKECGSFKNNHFCVYGDRCNFIHVTTPFQKQTDFPTCVQKNPDFEMELVRKIAQKESKLLKLLL